MIKKAFIPLLMGISMAFGIWLGIGLKAPYGQGQVEPGWTKIDQIIQYIENDYVDTVSREALEGEVAAYLLQKLDPHSHYISEEDFAAMNEPLEGNFEGIGIQFNLRRDTIYVVSTIAGGPSEQAGLKGGDLIVSVNGEVIAGTGLDNRGVMSLLKGEKGTSVNLGIKRKHADQLLYIDIIRGEIPISSFDAVYQLNDSTIYLRLARFSKTTHEEFVERVYPLKTKDITALVLDLRGNGGGYLDAAIKLVDEFIDGDAILTYTEGKNRTRTEYRASPAGKFHDVALAVIIDGYSASASEIVAGAIQDLGRGIVVGRRSYGKGLVQEQNEWTDGSATRLTVARYYTPKGRSIQRPYESMASGPLSSADSTVGGIIPDVEVDPDTAGITWLYAELIHSGRLSEFAYDYRDHHMEEMQAMGSTAFISSQNDADIESALRAFLESRAWRINESEWKRSRELMVQRAKAIIGRSIFGEETYFLIQNRHDAFVQKATSAIKKPVNISPAPF